MGENCEIYNYRDKKIKIRYEDTLLKIKKSIESDKEEFIYLLKKDSIDWSKIDKKYHYKIFTQDEYKSNILSNLMIPKHNKIDVYDKNKDKNLPIIKSYDIVVRKMNFKINDIIKIERRNGNNYYRRVF
jgi:DNA-directed RNA polymerase subunit H (RpoH/RPB5)